MLHRCKHNMQNKIVIAVSALLVVGAIYWFWFRQKKSDSYTPPVDFPIGETAQPIQYVSNDTIYGTTPVENVTTEVDNPDDFLTAFEKLYPSKHPEVRAKELQKDRFKEAVKNQPNMTIDHLPDLPLHLQVQGVDVKSVETYDNNHMVPKSTISPKLYDGFFTSHHTRQVYPQADGTVRVSDFGRM